MRVIARGLCGAGIAAVSIALLGTAVGAAAPDVVGKTYAQAKSAISSSGATAIVATRIGDRKADADCIVTSARDSDFQDSSGKSQGKSVLVNLNCYATATPHSGG